MNLPKLIPTGMSAGQGTYASLDGRFVFASTVERAVADPKKKVRVWTALDRDRKDVYGVLVVAAEGSTLDAVREGVEKYLAAVKATGTAPVG